MTGRKGGDKSQWLGGISEAFSDRNFRVYSTGSIGSWVGFFIQLVAVAWVTWDLTGSTTWLAIMGLMDVLPAVVLMPLAGALADRIDRHRIMIVTSGLLLVQALALTTLAAVGALNVWLLAALELAHGVLIAFMVPAMYGTLPRFVARSVLSSAIAVSSAYTQLAVFVGPAFAGWILIDQGAATAFAANTVGYLLLLIAFLRLRTPVDYQAPKAPTTSLWHTVLDGFRYMLADRLLRFLLGLGLVVDFVAVGFHQMLPAYSDTVLGMGVIGVSLVLSSHGAGAVASALWLARAGEAAISPERVALAVLAMFLALSAMMAVSAPWGVAVLGFVFGFAAETRRTSTMVLIQLSVSEELRGRVMGGQFMLFRLAGGIGALVIGWSAARHGVQAPVLAGCAIGLVLLVAIYGLWRRGS